MLYENSGGRQKLQLNFELNFWFDGLTWHSIFTDVEANGLIYLDYDRQTHSLDGNWN